MLASGDHGVVHHHGLRLGLRIADILVGLVGLVSLLDHARPHIDHSLPGGPGSLGTHHMGNSLKWLLDMVTGRCEVNSRDSSHGDLLAQSLARPGRTVGDHPGPHHHVLLWPPSWPQAPWSDHVQLLGSRAGYWSLSDDERSGHPQAGLDSLLLYLDLRHLELSLGLLDLPGTRRLDHSHHPRLLLPHRHPVGPGLGLRRHVVVLGLAPGGGRGVGRGRRLDWSRGAGAVLVVVEVLGLGGGLQLLVLAGLQVVVVEVLRGRGRGGVGHLVLAWLDVDLLVVPRLLGLGLRLGLGLGLGVLG